MMFITPTPPTINPTLETANMKMKMPPVSWFHRSCIWSVVMREKLSDWLDFTWRRRRSTSRTSSITAGMFACESALMLIQLSRISGCSLRKVR